MHEVLYGRLTVINTAGGRPWPASYHVHDRVLNRPPLMSLLIRLRDEAWFKMPWKCDSRPPLRRLTDDKGPGSKLCVQSTPL